MRIPIITFFFISVLLLNCRKSEKKPDSWVLVFQDDFNSQEVDQANWSIYNSPGNAGNGLRRPEAFTVANGYLTLTAGMNNGSLVSGGMAQIINQIYGKYEFRVRTEPDSNEATSGVVLTWPQSERWPVDGENDMYETGQEASRSSFNTNIHYGTSPSTQYSFHHQVDATQWHTVAMEWTSGSIKIYRDSILVWTLIEKAAIPKVPHHLCIQLDAFKSTMTGIVHMDVDWVKIYRLDSND